MTLNVILSLIVSFLSKEIYLGHQLKDHI